MAKILQVGLLGCTAVLAGVLIGHFVTPRDLESARPDARQTVDDLLGR